MVTYRRDLERKGWHRPWPVRVAAVFLGIPIFLLGMVAWSLEDIYGGDDDRQEYVTSEEVGGPVRVHDQWGIVFEGTQEEVDAWLAAERGSRNYTVPFVMTALGVLLVLVGVTPSPRRTGITPSDVAPDESESMPMQLT